MQRLSRVERLSLRLLSATSLSRYDCRVQDGCNGIENYAELELGRYLELCGNCTQCSMNALAKATVNGGVETNVLRVAVSRTSSCVTAAFD